MDGGHEVSRLDGVEALTFRLSPEDLSKVKFALSPLQEAVMSLGVLSDPGRHVVHLPWVEGTLEALRGADAGRGRCARTNLGTRHHTGNDAEETTIGAPTDAARCLMCRCAWAPMSPHLGEWTHVKCARLHRVALCLWWRG